MHGETDTQDELAPSKSELKRRVEALQKAGEALIDLPPVQLAKIPLSNELRSAVQEAARMRNKRAAYKRQRQYIGRLMREADAQPILEALHDLQSTHLAETSRFHEIEYWRDALLSATAAEALTELVAAHPGVDVQQLRNQVGKAQRELKSGRNRHAQRELFAVLRDMLENSE
jgi:ribosome-associated protein